MAQGSGDGARAPRRRSTTTPSERGIYGEILALISGLDSRVEAVGTDARDARDGVMKLTAGLDAQGIPAKIAELDGKIDRGLDAARSDLVNAQTNIKRELRDKHDAVVARVAALEGSKAKADGAIGLLGWITKNAPWLLSIAMAGLALLGFKEKLP